MVYEVDNNLTTTPRGKSASRTLLRLHRAMIFLRLFAEQLLQNDPSAPAGPAANAAYKSVVQRKRKGKAEKGDGPHGEILPPWSHLSSVPISFSPPPSSPRVTMYDHHIWLVRKTVAFALSTLGSTKDMLARIRGTVPEEEANAMLR